MEPFPRASRSEELPTGSASEEGLESDQPVQPYRAPEGSRLEVALGDGNLEYLLPGLPELEQEIILRRNGLGGHEKTTLDRTGQLLNYSRERIRQLENQALRRLAILAEERRRQNT